MLTATIQKATAVTPPTYQAAGTVQSGTGAITPTWPTHQAGDVALLIVETANQTISLSTPAGFAEVTNSPQGTGTAGGTTATRLAVYWKRAATSAESNPTVADSGDHQIARIITFRGVISSGNPWDVTAGNVASSASTSVSIPGATTTTDSDLVVVVVANATDTTSVQASGWTNSNLTSLTERVDNNTNSGNGGGFGVATGVKATAGAYGTTTATLVTSSVQARMSIAIKPGSAPGAATSPSPANSATSISLTADLSWTAGSGATSHNVYFGTTSPGTYQGNQAGTTFDTGTMTAGTTYYWRIDEVNAYGTTTGTVWSFTTGSVPGVAASPSPANSATSISLTADLSWTAGSGATSHNVYFGTTSPGTYQGNQAGTTFDTGTMTAGTTYYWRIDEVNAYGTTTGTVWSFTTESKYIYVDINASDPNADGTTWAKAYTSIQTAINTASSGKVIMVAPGTYPEYINLNSKAVTVTSTDPNDPNVVDATIINPANTTKDVITCNSGETSATIIDGLTLTGGQSGICVSNAAAPFITKCVIRGNGYYGMYVTTSSSSMTISKCTIRNQTSGYGYGFYGYGNVTLQNCLIVKNRYGVYVSSSTGTFRVINCTVADNTYGGTTGSFGTEDIITNTILWNNKDDFAGMTPPSVPTYCCIEDGDAGTGNISVDPMFVDSANNDYHVLLSSCCIDAGDPNSAYSNEPLGGGGRINMGAYGNTEDATTVSDADNDGIADEWELQYWPNDDPNQHDPNDDPDGDGLRNKDEFRINWNPTQNNSGLIHGFATNPATGYRYPSVNHAIRFASANDILILDPNHFVEAVNFGSKRVHLRSTDPNDPNVVAATIIDAADTTKDVLTCNSGETSATIIEGITLTGGQSGICVSNTAAPFITKCVIAGNRYYGMYITTSSSSMAISNCIIKNQNQSNAYGFYGYGNITLQNCLVVKNYRGVYVSGGTGTFRVINCTVADNTYSGVTGSLGTEDVVTNSILWNNGDDFSGMYPPCVPTYCCIEDGDAGTGNINSNPQFVNAINSDYHLGLNSPCVDAGDPASAYSNEPQGGGGRIDMGAYGNTNEATFVFDGDGDGIPDSWERQYWPNDYPSQHAPNDDPDSDGLTNMEECLIDWNPTHDDSSSIPGFVRNQRTSYKYPSVHLAIDYAEEDDILVVDPNHFIETVNLGGKRVHVRSTDPNDPNVVAATIIDANDTTKDVLTCNSGETSATIIEGLTLTSGRYGIYTESSSVPLITKCVIKQNSSYGMYVNAYSGSMAISKCTVTQNGNNGFYGYGNVTLKNCLFVDNDGMGISVSDSWGAFTIDGCTIANNHNYGIYGQSDEVKNSIIWNNGDDISSNCTTSYCCIEDGDAGTGNISSNPQFVNAAVGDYHLKSTAGRWNGASWVTDAINSPCIDAGQPWADYSLEPAGANGGRVNMGAYGNTPEASKSVDSDSDGLSDAWEMSHFGNLNQNAVGAGGNFDNDDFDNQIEYYFNYDPNAITTKDIEIANLSQSAAAFNPTLNQTIVFDFWFNKAVRLRLKDADSNDIFFDSQTNMTPGHNQIVWDGTAVSDALIIKKGSYDWRLETFDAAVGIGSKDKTDDNFTPVNLTYGHQITSMSCNPRRIIPVFNEVAVIAYGIDFGGSLTQWPVTISIDDPDGQLFATVISDYNHTESDFSVIWNGKNGPDGNSASRYPSKNGEYTIKVGFTGMRESATKSIYIYK